MDVCIIGGGAAGLVCGISAALCANKVRILEARDRIGKKILATGNGKCNMTNADMSLSHYHGIKSEADSRQLINDVFNKFSSKDTVRFFEQLGISVIYRNGYAYPRSEQASSVLDALRFKLASLNAEIICDCRVKSIRKENGIFVISSENGEFTADKVVLSCGSKASLPGNAPDGYYLAKSFGHNIINPYPALVPIVCSGSKFKSLSGIRTQGTITVYDGKDEVIASAIGELQLRDYGVSGIPAFMVSADVSSNIGIGKKLYLILDFMPDVSFADLVKLLKQRIKDCPYKTAENYLIGLFNKNLALALLKESSIDLKFSVTDFTDSMIDNLANQIKNFRAEIIGTKGIEDAQICAGGVDVCEIKSNLESKIIDGLYFAGEMIDVHGDCGGYNLQWAFSSGMVCGND